MTFSLLLMMAVHNKTVNMFRFGQIKLIWLLFIFRAQALLKCKKLLLVLSFFLEGPTIFENT